MAFGSAHVQNERSKLPRHIIVFIFIILAPSIQVSRQGVWLPFWCDITRPTENDFLLLS